MQSKENFRNTLKYKTLILKYLLNHESITVSGLQDLYPELSTRTARAYIDRLFRSGHIVQHGDYGKHNAYALTDNRRDVCVAIVNYYTKLGII